MSRQLRPNVTVPLPDCVVDYEIKTSAAGLIPSPPLCLSSAHVLRGHPCPSRNHQHSEHTAEPHRSSRGETLSRTGWPNRTTCSTRRNRNRPASLLCGPRIPPTPSPWPEGLTKRPAVSGFSR